MVSSYSILASRIWLLLEICNPAVHMHSWALPYEFAFPRLRKRNGQNPHEASDIQVPTSNDCPKPYTSQTGNYCAYFWGPRVA